MTDTTNLRPPNLELTIDRLVLDGALLVNNDSTVIRAAIESELARLLSLHAPAWTGSPGKLPVATIHVRDSTAPANLGRQIAHAVHGSLVNNPAPASTQRSREGVTE